MRSTYSQKAYPFDRPVALSFTKLKALSSPNDASSSLTCGGKRRIKQTLVTSMKLSCAEVNTATCSQSYLPGMQCVNYCHLIALMLPTETKFKVKKKKHLVFVINVLLYSFHLNGHTSGFYP